MTPGAPFWPLRAVPPPKEEVLREERPSPLAEVGTLGKKIPSVKEKIWGEIPEERMGKGPPLHLLLLQGE